MAKGARAGGGVAVYAEKGGRVRLEVRLEGDTVWLTLAQMAELFGRDKSVISRHLRNVFSSGEVHRRAAVARNATTAADGKTYQVDHYNLDAILSVGYRVNSIRGTRFRIWATDTLRQHLLRGFTLNERRLRETGLSEMEQTVGLLARTLKGHDLVTDQGRAVLDVVEQYTRSWRLLVAYDERRLAESPTRPRTPDVALGLEQARRAIAALRPSQAAKGRSAGLFGHERDQQLAAILGNVEQTFGGAPLYPSVQVRAAHLLYFLIKDHPFSDGNKRIGALLFLEYNALTHALPRRTVREAPTMYPAFARYVGIDYSGAETPTDGLPGLRIYLAEAGRPAVEVLPPAGRRKYWTRRGIAEWLVERLRQPAPTVVGIDHAFSFPIRYFDEHGVARDWPSFLEDFQRHWPTDEEHVYVSFVRDGVLGNGAARSGGSKWKRRTEVRARSAKSVFHFDVPGSVAHSTHAGLPWLLFLRRQLADRVHFWPFDGWTIPEGRSAVVEVYPSLWRSAFPRQDRTLDQHDAYSVAEWLRQADRDGRLATFLQPSLATEDRAEAEIEGWILGVL